MWPKWNSPQQAVACVTWLLVLHLQVSLTVTEDRAPAVSGKAVWEWAAWALSVS